MAWKCSLLFRRQMCPHPKGPATAKSSIVTGIVARLKPWQLTLILNIFNGLLTVDNEDPAMDHPTDAAAPGVPLKLLLLSALECCLLCAFSWPLRYHSRLTSF